MESRFGYDFSPVRVHVEADAATRAEVMRASAFTVGAHIAFNRRSPGPATSAGQQLLAHELTHVVQQQAARPLNANHRRGPHELTMDNLTPAPTLIQRSVFGEHVSVDSLPGPPPRAELLAPYRDAAVAQELYGDPTVPLVHLSATIIEVDYQRLKPEWRAYFDTPEQGAEVAPSDLRPQNIWPFPGFSADQISRYIDTRVNRVAVNLVLGRAFVGVEGRDQDLEVPLSWFDTADHDVAPITPPRGSEVEARSELPAFAELAAGGLTPVLFYPDSEGILWPTTINPQTAPRLMSVYPAALAAARDDARATAEGLTHLAFWYVGARLGMGRPKPPSQPTGAVGARLGMGRPKPPSQPTGAGASTGQLIKASDLMLPPGGRQALARLTQWTTGGKGLAGQEANLAKTAELIKALPSRIGEIRAGGVTKEMAQQWAQFYRQVAAETPAVAEAGNPNALARAQLMQAIADLL